MKRYLSWVVLFSVLILFSGCAYLNVKLPYDTDLDKTVLGEKVGEASCYSILWLIAWGDAGTAAAARNGGITVLNHMDMEVVNILFGIYTKETTIVYGE